MSKAARATSEAELAKMPDVDAPEPGERERRYLVMRDHGGDIAMASTLIGSIVVKAREIVVETNSSAMHGSSRRCARSTAALLPGRHLPMMLVLSVI